MASNSSTAAIPITATVFGVDSVQRTPASGPALRPDFDVSVLGIASPTLHEHVAGNRDVVIHHGELARVRVRTFDFHTRG